MQLHGSPTSMYASSSRNASFDLDTSDRKRKRLSAAGQEDRARTMTSDSDEAPRRSSVSLPNLTSKSHDLHTLTAGCEACRKGKRRCEPSPLVPPTHPDAAKLPCARCRRFALECVRVKVTRRKGPAPVAISDAVHGFVRDNPRRSSTLASGISADDSSFPILASSTSRLPDNLDQVVAGHVIDNIIGLFFDYIYPLIPCLHRPTFIANLTNRNDKSDPVFFALALTCIASTLVQVPRSLVNLEKSEVESLARRCIRVARAKLAFVYEEPANVQSTFIVISYLEGIVHLLLGNNTAHVIATAQANQLALALRLNEESSYDTLGRSAMRRRIYWLLFQADKSTACLRARTICLRLEDAANLRLPSEVDDEFITPNGIHPQPLGRTPLIAGFNVNTNLFRILNDALLLQRRKAPPTVDSILADLQNVNELREKVLQTTLQVATPLQMRKGYDSRLSSPAQDWEAKLQGRFLDFFHSAGDTSHALNSFLVMQGNILVTQHVVRLVLLQTRESLFQQLAMITQMPLQGVGGLAGQQTSEAAEDIACELLDGLNSLPVECVATNGPSLVQKVRFVAIQLMECSISPSPTTARAQKLLMQFLSVLGVIEGMYTFGRDISAE
ncbi:fungal-specific transcription factor domain-domain-containing protein [Naematelia encephala]|uniref:Fungal-specific transcription factor domain-domain-containing protein n=1 Tax=Naematelia encephala TaxID=71784 RepID=A0A1Y2AL84_9TREE|nr:fungal-specific transcription factor domain-domain-containing protein [Naematelia encephala]